MALKGDVMVKTNKIGEVIVIILSIIAIITCLIAIVMLITKLTGHSPDALTILSWSVGAILALEVVIISVLFPMKGAIGRLEEFKNNIKEFQRETIVEIKKLKNKI